VGHGEAGKGWGMERQREAPWRASERQRAAPPTLSINEGTSTNINKIKDKSERERTGERHKGHTKPRERQKGNTMGREARGCSVTLEARGEKLQHHAHRPSRSCSVTPAHPQLTPTTHPHTVKG
jgi:hypothetical protein